MTDESRFDTLDEAVVEVGRAVDEMLEEHPDADTLLAHHRRQLPAEQAALVDDHLLWCRDCAQFGRRASGAVTDEKTTETAEPVEVDPRERAEDLAALRRQLAVDDGESDESSAASVIPLSSGRADRAFDRPTLALAASVALVCLVGGIWAGAVFLGSGPATDGELQANVPLYDLSDLTARRAVPPEMVTIDGNSQAVLILNTLIDSADANYVGRVLDSENRPVLRVRDLVATDFGNFTLLLPAGSLAPGEYLLELVAEGSDEASASFGFRVVGSPSD